MERNFGAPTRIAAPKESGGLLGDNNMQLVVGVRISRLPVLAALRGGGGQLSLSGIGEKSEL